MVKTTSKGRRLLKHKAGSLYNLAKTCLGPDREQLSGTGLGDVLFKDIQRYCLFLSDFGSKSPSNRAVFDVDTAVVARCGELCKISLVASGLKAGSEYTDVRNMGVSDLFRPWLRSPSAVPKARRCVNRSSVS